MGDRLWHLTPYIQPQLGLQLNYHIQKVFYLFVIHLAKMYFPFQITVLQTVPVLVSRTASLLLLLFFPHAVTQTRKGSNRYLLNEGSVPPSLMNAAYGCPRAASVSDFRDCLYNLSHLLFLLGHRVAEPEWQKRYRFNYASWFSSTERCTKLPPVSVGFSYFFWHEMCCALGKHSPMHVSVAAVGPVYVSSILFDIILLIFTSLGKILMSLIQAR